MKHDLLSLAVGDNEAAPVNMMSATAPRPLLLSSEPEGGMVWLELNGKEAGFEPDSKKYRLFPLRAKLGSEFERQLINREFPEAVRLLDRDTDIRSQMRGAVAKTIEHIRKKTPVLAKVGLAWVPDGLMGCADLCVLSTALYQKYPHLKPQRPEREHYVVLDAKVASRLESKKLEMSAIAVQLRIYSYILGKLQGYMPKRAFVISRDHIADPLEIDVSLELDESLPADIRALWDDFNFIREQQKDRFLRQKDNLLLLNPASSRNDGEWSEAKQGIIEESQKSRPLAMLPGVGPTTAAKMRELMPAYKSVEDLISLPVREIDKLNLEAVPGISRAKSERIKAVLKATKTGRASRVPGDLLPRRASTEFYIDLEHFTGLNIDWDKWPNLTGTPMIFMIGIGWREAGKFQFKRFTADEETYDGERRMLQRFLAFLRENGVFDETCSSRLFCYSSAERVQIAKAAERHNLRRLRELEDKWFDVLKVFLDGRVAIPGMWSYSLKSVTEALGTYASRYGVQYGDAITGGDSAMVAGWAAYEQEQPLKSPEMLLLAEYLETDVQALCNTVMWLRAVARQQAMEENLRSGGWYATVRTAVVAEPLSLNSAGWYALATGRYTLDEDRVKQLSAVM